MPEALSPGDVVDVAVTHEIVIGGEKSWIKYGVQSKVRTNESTKDAETRVVDHVNVAVMDAIQETVKVVRNMT